MNPSNSDIATTLKGIIDTAIDGIITIDDRGIVESMNPAAAGYFKYVPDEVIGNNIKMLMPEPYQSEHDGYLHRYNKTKEPRIIGIGREVTGKTKHGEYFPFRLAVSEVILNDRVIFAGIIHDLSDIRSAEKKLVKLNQELEEKVQLRTEELESAINKLLETNEALNQREGELNVALTKEKELGELKSRFVSMASHEFRTPLSTIMSSASLISKYTEESHNDKREKHVNRIKRAVVNLTGILNDFLSLSKIEEGKIELKRTDFGLQNLCNEVIDEVKGLLKPGQEIIHNHEDCEIHSDYRVLKNILFNLISNAIKYSPAEKEIYCTITEKEAKVIFEVRDQGIGIPESEQKHLFDRFFRASNVETIQGTGLGLSIVKRYCELLGGSISFVSAENHGTTFTVSVPKNVTL